MGAAHGRWAAELSTFETHAKAWLVGLFGLPPAAVLVALEGAGVSLPTWATALLALLPVLAAALGVVVGPANKVTTDLLAAVVALPHAGLPVQQGPTLTSGELSDPGPQPMHAGDDTTTPPAAT